MFSCSSSWDFHILWCFYNGGWSSTLLELSKMEYWNGRWYSMATNVSSLVKAFFIVLHGLKKKKKKDYLLLSKFNIDENEKSSKELTWSDLMWSSWGRRKLFCLPLLFSLLPHSSCHDGGVGQRVEPRLLCCRHWFIFGRFLLPRWGRFWRLGSHRWCKEGKNLMFPFFFPSISKLALPLDRLNEDIFFPPVLALLFPLFSHGGKFLL